MKWIVISSKPFSNPYYHIDVYLWLDVGMNYK
jgi:hypothetical protein